VPSPLTGRFGLIFAGRSQGNSSTTFSIVLCLNGLEVGRKKRTESVVLKDENT
jgi:hypothetical protein